MHTGTHIQTLTRRTGEGKEPQFELPAVRGHDPYQTLCQSAYCALGRTQIHTHIHTCINLHGLHDDVGGDSKAAGWRCCVLMRGPNLIIIIYSLYLSEIYRCKHAHGVHICENWVGTTQEAHAVRVKYIVHCMYV